MNDAQSHSQPRVLIADDHPPTRAGVRAALERDGIEVCAEAANAADAVEAAQREHPDVCLLDVNMPGGGTSAAAMITFRLPGTVVLMLSVSRDDEDLFESLRQGATGYLLKDMDPSKLPAAVRGALDGEGALPGELVARLIEEFRHGRRVRRLANQPRDLPELTKREWDVLELLCEGAGTGDIANRLFLSRVTVRRHISNILTKLGASSREEAASLARASQQTVGSAGPDRDSHP